MIPLRPGWPLVFGLMMAIFTYILVGSYTGIRFEHGLEEKRRSILRDLHHAQDALERVLDERLALAYGLRGFVEVKPDYSHQEFQSFALEMVERIKGIRALEITRGSVITDICPLEGNERALNLDLRTLPSEWR